MLIRHRIEHVVDRARRAVSDALDDPISAAQNLPWRKLCVSHAARESRQSALRASAGDP
jgi:uncharacterized membrane protein